MALLLTWVITSVVPVLSTGTNLVPSNFYLSSSSIIKTGNKTFYIRTSTIA